MSIGVSIGLRVLLFAIGYGFGLFQTGYIYGKIIHVDLKKQGSGNTGATNALRVLGLKGALIVFFGDALKSFIPTFATRMICQHYGMTDMAYIYALYAALGVIIGNNYPCYLGFKGGKGVAATSGFMLAIDWKIWLFNMCFFFAVAFATRYVSLASCLSAVLVGTMTILAAKFNLVGIWFTKGVVFGTPAFIEFSCLIAFLALMMIWRHKTNLKRLANGTENRFGSKKKA